jgi:hypothetical protein
MARLTTDWAGLMNSDLYNKLVQYFTVRVQHLKDVRRLLPSDVTTYIFSAAI